MENGEWVETRIFADRMEAAAMLARQLTQYRREHPVVLGIPRGALPMAKLIAGDLDGELDAVLVKKIGAPDNPDFAIGSVNEDGVIHLSDSARRFDITEAYIRRQAELISSQLAKRRELYRHIRPQVDLADRCVILVDDGTVSGANLMAAINYVKEREPAKVIAAAAVMSERAFREIKPHVDEIVALMVPHEVLNLSEFFSMFSDISENVVTRILVEAAEESRLRARTIETPKTPLADTPDERPRYN